MFENFKAKRAAAKAEREARVEAARAAKLATERESMRGTIVDQLEMAEARLDAVKNFHGVTGADKPDDINVVVKAGESIVTIQPARPVKAVELFDALGQRDYSLLLGTFLVRSGILTSVHAFAVDPTRGAFILALLAIYIGGALNLFAIPRWGPAGAAAASRPSRRR